LDPATLTAIALIITACGTVLTAATAFYGVLVSKRNGERIQQVASHVEKVERATNGMKSELVSEVRQASFAAGEKSEKDKGGHADQKTPAEG
jgi:hypothetical protein